MTFEVGETINQIVDAFLRAPVIYSIARNPIYTALVITLIILLIVAFIFRDIDSDECLLVMTLRTGFWVFIMMLGVIMVHNRVLTGEDLREKRNKSYEEVFGSSAGVQLDSDFVPVAPSIHRSNMHGNNSGSNISNSNDALSTGISPGGMTCELSKPY